VDLAKAFSAMNDEFRTGKLVANPFTVYARPSRASGWVNLRWAPSTEAERIATCSQGKALTVIGETRNWYQVQDPQTGMIGFISRQYVSAQ
jgi:SH3-like domain-containing protein